MTLIFLDKFNNFCILEHCEVVNLFSRPHDLKNRILVQVDTAALPKRGASMCSSSKRRQKKNGSRRLRRHSTCFDAKNRTDTLFVEKRLRLFFCDEEISLLAWREPYRNEKIFIKDCFLEASSYVWRKKSLLELTFQRSADHKLVC